MSNMNSLHSRSSSEVEATPYSEIIPVFSKDLRKDFDFNDVKDNVRNLFTDIEYDYIVKEKGEAQILHLIWVLQNKRDTIITTFLDTIDAEYHWIVEKIRREINDHQPETLNYLETLKTIQSEHQSHTDYNVHRTKQFLKLRTALRKLNPKSGQKNTAIILGDLGSGKKWLSLDVVSDY
ncbi:hypothetical protein DOY81_012525 [Sarcophaga bullata]|nr:hypothetical protein DOY81_012525 [Sarcophaga bullata]